MDTGYSFNLIERTDLQRGDNHVALSNLSTYYTWKNIKDLHRNNRFKIAGKTVDEEFELPGESYCKSDIENYFKYVIRRHEILADKSPVSTKFRIELQSELNIGITLNSWHSRNFLEILKKK